MTGEFDGLVAVVTGGASGIGLATAGLLAQRGATVAVFDLQHDNLPAGLHPYVVDVTNRSSIDAAVAAVATDLGRLDILVNNAGIAAGVFPGTGPEHSATLVEANLLHKVFETNFFAPVALTNALLPLLKKSPAGRIVNLSSILGSLTLQADPNSPIYHAKSFAYDASKTALNAYTIHLAHELRDTSIKVNSAHPGWVKTDMGGPQAPMELS